MNPTDNLVIHTQRLGKYCENVQALQNVDLRVPRHSILGFLDPNDAGVVHCLEFAADELVYPGGLAILLALPKPSQN